MPPVFGKENICGNVFNPTPNRVVGFFTLKNKKIGITIT
jgi:hypothetical protein